MSICKDRAGEYASLLFFQEQGLYSVVTAEQYADIVVAHSPAVEHDPSQREKLKTDILGDSDGVPGLLRNDSIVLVRGVPGALPRHLLEHPANLAAGRLRGLLAIGEKASGCLL